MSRTPTRADLRSKVQRLPPSTATSDIARDTSLNAEHYQAVIDDSDDAIITKTLTGHVSSWNAAAQRMFGYSAEEMVGRSMRLLIPRDRLYEEDFILERVVKGEKVDHFETTRIAKGGRPVRVSVAISPIRDAAGVVVGASKIVRDVTQRSKLEQAARQLYQSIVESTDDAVVGTSLTGVVTSWNQGAARMFGYAAAEIVGESFARLLVPARLREETVLLMRIRSGEHIQQYQTERVRKEGSVFPASVNISPILDADGRVIGASNISRDITAQVQAQTQLRLTASVFTYTSEGILSVDRKGRIVEVNAASSCITGYSKSESIGRDPRMFRSSRQGPEVFQAMWLALVRHGEWRGEIWSRRKDGEAYSVMLTASRVRGATGQVQNYVVLISDITPLRLEQEKIEHWAHFDPLTDLPNRWLLSDRLAQAIANSGRHKLSVAVLYLDLDGFKRINDTYGHPVGDEFLIALSHRMRAAMRDVDTLARMGGDEFVAVLTDLSSYQDSIRLTERILQACAQPITIGNQHLAVTASIGLTVFPQDNSEPDLLLRHADQAMYDAKRDGKNKYSIFDAQQDTAYKHRGAHQERVLQAIERNELVLY